jgi:DNA repair exonuclease SbcCD ATPase subunit
VLGDLASSRNSKRFSLLILDDVFEKLSDRVCDSIIRVLRKMVSGDPEGLPSRKSIFVLSHLDSFREKFENRLTMEDVHGEKILREI